MVAMGGFDNWGLDFFRGGTGSYAMTKAVRLQSSISLEQCIFVFI